MLAPSGEDATVIFPVDDVAAEVPVGTIAGMVVFDTVVLFPVDDRVTEVSVGTIVVVVDTVVFVVTCSDAAFVGITVVVAVTGYVVIVVRLVSVSVGTVVEFVVFWLSAATGIMINAIITRRINCARVFFTVRSPLSPI
jgi:hypothetical protein